MLNKEIPFLRIGLPLCAGIISGLYIKPDFHLLFSSFIICASGFTASLYFNKNQLNQLYGLTLTASLFICGLALYTNEKSTLSSLKPEETTFVGTLSDYPEEKENSIMMTVRLNLYNNRTGSAPLKGSVLLYNKKESKVKSFLPGDVLTFKCTPVEITNRGNPYEFDYRFYMENHGIRYYAFTTGDDIISHIIPKKRGLTYNALIVRNKIIEMYEKRGITGERLALVAAITLGEKSKLDPEQKQNFMRAGVMHIMAVSGLHAVVLSLFVFNLLFFMKGKFNFFRIIITILILWSFAFVTGLTPSVLRATLMFTFLQAGNLMKRKVNGINSVLASAFVLILIKPSVIFDAGFLLSYSAVIYIISFYQHLYLSIHNKNWLADKIWQSAAVTMVAQAGTLPLTIMLFNRFPVYFILTNLLIVPLSSLLIVIACTIPILYSLTSISTLLASVLNFLTGVTEYLASSASSLPFSNIENIGMTTVECVLLMVAIYLIITFILKKQPISVFYPVLLLLLYVSASTIREYRTRKTNELIVYNTPGSSNIGIRTGKILNVYSDSNIIRPEILRHSATLGLRIRQNTLTNRFYSIVADGKSITICNSLDKYVLQNIPTDFIILTGAEKTVINSLMEVKPHSALIITSQPSVGFHLPPRFYIKGPDTVHFVRKSGAYMKRI